MQTDHHSLTSTSVDCEADNRLCQHEAKPVNRSEVVVDTVASACRMSMQVFTASGNGDQQPERTGR